MLRVIRRLPAIGQCSAGLLKALAGWRIPRKKMNRHGPSEAAAKRRPPTLCPFNAAIGSATEGIFERYRQLAQAAEEARKPQPVGPLMGR